MSDVIWHKVAELDELPEGRVKTVVAGRKSLALTHFDGAYGALDNHCPHQGGPLGEGSIEWETTAEPPGEHTGTEGVESTRRRAWLRCPWHGYDYSPLTGARPPGFAASAYGKLTGKLAACFAIAGPGSTNLLTGLYDAKVDRAPVLALSGQVPSKVRGRGAFQDLDLAAAFSDVACYSQTVQRDSDHAELMNLACKHALVQRGVAHLVLPDDVQTLPAGDARAGSPSGRLSDTDIAPAEAAVDSATALTTGAERPVIIVGHG